jgi:hypothetical protein
MTIGLPMPIAIATAADRPLLTAIIPIPIAAMSTPIHTITR